jgi:ATP-dependent DNA helicase RecG
LLQGDVGSGKTAVAACCALFCIESGFNVALMAPTEILAEQHFQTFTRWLEPLGIAVRLQTGSHKPAKTEAIEPSQELLPIPGTAAVQGPSITIGTHALIEGGCSLDNLGLVIIDEQHRFGVVQRETLVRKGQYPHLLVMTATPIPRTLGLTIYGDLDISILDELPAGRSPVKTFVRTAQSLDKVWTFVLEKLKEGRQAFVVMPRVDDTGQGVRAVTREFEAVQQRAAPYKVGLLHGRLSAADRDVVMGAFRANLLQVLLSTSLIEVGVDVPNATIMLIENAEQFGLAQLHQLRGRIGRGAHESHCVLLTEARTRDAQQRLQILAKTTDGFAIAEADLKLRGAGDLLGQQQSGLPPLRFADLAEDLPLVQEARGIAARLLRGSGGDCAPASESGQRSATVGPN